MPMLSNRPLYLVTDHRIPFDLLLEKVKICLEEGIHLLQYRNKYADTAVMHKEATMLKLLCDQYDVPLIINDRLDIALSVDAAGVHLGQNDLPVDIAKSLLPEGKYLGVSVHNAKEAVLAMEQGADHVGVGALFHTSTKSDAKSISLIVLKDIKNIVGMDVPVYGIGGITPENLTKEYTEVLDGIAVISAILSEDDPTQAIKEFQKVL